MNGKNRRNELEELKKVSLEWKCSVREVMLELLIEFYAAAGFCEEQLEKEFYPMNDDELLDAFCNM